MVYGGINGNNILLNILLISTKSKCFLENNETLAIRIRFKIVGLECKEHVHVPYLLKLLESHDKTHCIATIYSIKVLSKSYYVLN